jgi:hypothetical protein
VPLELTFIGVADKGPFLARNQAMADVCYDKVSDSLRRGYQAMVFVHSRKDTGKTARGLAEGAQRAGEGALFNGRRAMVVGGEEEQQEEGAGGGGGGRGRGAGGRGGGGGRGAGQGGGRGASSSTTTTTTSSSSSTTTTNPPSAPPPKEEDPALAAAIAAAAAARDDPANASLVRDARRSRNREVAELFELGLGIHHAGMLRADRTLTERLFAAGIVRVLCCTATLAWGVNLPAHTVVIKGTQIYDAKKGAFSDLSMLDVQQIFGRAGRPQFDTSGEGIIITQHGKLAHYLGMLTLQLPIESAFPSLLVDNLNAEIVLGTVSNIREAAAWLGYTYFARRAAASPLAYGLSWEQAMVREKREGAGGMVFFGFFPVFVGFSFFLFFRLHRRPFFCLLPKNQPTNQSDPGLEQHRRALVTSAAQKLRESQMAVFDERSGNLYVTGGSNAPPAPQLAAAAPSSHTAENQHGGTAARARPGALLGVQRTLLLLPILPIPSLTSKTHGHHTPNNRTKQNKPNKKPTHPPNQKTELGRVASHFYVRHQSMVLFNERLKPHVSEADVLAMMSESSEFDSMAVRCVKLCAKQAGGPRAAAAHFRARPLAPLSPRPRPLAKKDSL